MKVAIIGGGASGVLCALKLKKLNSLIDVTIFEATNKLLKKVSISGNGRCNLGNENIFSNAFLNPAIIDEMAEYKDASKEFFREIGLLTTTDNEGRIYPLSNQASNVVEYLGKLLFFHHVKVNLNHPVKKIIKTKNSYQIFDEVYDYVVISTGSNAGINYDDSYDLINDLGLETSELRPGLVGFRIQEDLKMISGVRTSVIAKAFGKETCGEVIFKDDGISGICIMDLSIFKNNESLLSLDLFPNYSADDLLTYAKQKLLLDKNLRLHNLLSGTINSKIVNYINQKFENVQVNLLKDEDIFEYIAQFKTFNLTIKSTYDKINAQVICGGVNFTEVDNFELIKYPHMYITGEVLNQVGICGGYNLWFAFTTGIMVAEAILKKV